MKLVVQYLTQVKWLDGLKCHLIWRPRPRRLYVRWGPSSPPQKGGGAHLPNFRPMSIVAKRMDESTWHFAWRWASVQATFCPPQRGVESTILAYFYCDQTAGWIMMPLGTEVGLGPSDIVSDGVAAPFPPKWAQPQFSVHVYCGQTAGWMNTPLGTEVDFGPSHIVLDGDPARCSPRERGTTDPLFSAYVYCGHGRPPQLLLSSCQFTVM